MNGKPIYQSVEERKRLRDGVLWYNPPKVRKKGVNFGFDYFV